MEQCQGQKNEDKKIKAKALPENKVTIFLH